MKNLKQVIVWRQNVMVKFEPKETGLKRTVWLFEREILVNLEKTDLKDHHKVLTFNIFSMEYELNPEFDNGRADAIVMRNTANHWLKMWFVAFQTCASEKIQSQQVEVDEANAKSQMCRDEKTHAINRWSQIRKEVEEKDKRIADLELALTQIKSWESHPKNYETGFGSWGLRDFYRNLADKALRGEHE